MSQMNLQTLVEGIRSGNEAAFHEFYTHISPRVFTYIIPRVATRDEALDMLQEVFVALWSGRLRFSYINDASVYGFVFTITRRTLAAYYKNKQRHKRISETAPDDRYDMDIESIGDVRTVEKALAKLSDNERHLIILRHWNELSFAEIADIEQSSENTVRVRHHRTLEKLKTLLADHRTLSL